MVEDFGWTLKLGRSIYFPNLPYSPVFFLVQISWGFAIIKYFYISKFIINLFVGNYKGSIYNLFEKIVYIISGIFTLHYFASALAGLLTSTKIIDSQVKSVTSIVILPFLILSSLLYSNYKVQRKKVPKILKNQLKTLTFYLIIPYLFLEYSQAIPRFIFPSEFYTYIITSVSTTLLSFFLYYSIKRIILLRFLNIKAHVTSEHNFKFFENFTNVLEQLSFTTNLTDLGNATQQFFHENFNIHKEKINLYIISNDSYINIRTKINHANNTFYRKTKNFITSNKEYIQKNKIIILDEIELNYSYNRSIININCINFLKSIHASIFLSIYEKEKITGFIIIGREDKDIIFNDIEKNEMILFSKYLHNMINLLKTTKINNILLEEKELKEELQNKAKEIEQSKESFRSILYKTKDKEIGFILYKDNKLKFLNNVKQIINLKISEINLIKNIANKAIEYKTEQKHIFYNKQNKIIILATPIKSKNEVIIFVYKSLISNTALQGNNLFKDPTKWDYILNLETTKSGKLINELIPSTGEKLLNFKIELLKVALTEKAILLQLPKEDLLSMVDIIHNISLKNNLHILSLEKKETNYNHAIKLLGINPIFGIKTSSPLLEKLEGNNTLFIENIENLKTETQEYLAEFIKFGFFKVFKSDKKINSNVRIIFSTNSNLKNLIEEGNFSLNLFNELKHTTLSMPSLLSLPKKELANLAEELAQKTSKDLTNKKMKNINFNRNKPLSLNTLKAQIHELLDIQKNTKKLQTTTYSAWNKIDDPIIKQAIKLGKQTLKNQKLMLALWDKLHNQNQIANLLKVNRSFVSRRYKKYDLNF
jgi:transcriptional regulator with GAF, ATPase, and Fis domain